MAEIKKKEHVIMEGNLLEYPIFSMQKRRVDRTIEEYVWEERNGAGEITGERRFKVECTRGVPNYFDMDVFNGICGFMSKKAGDITKPRSILQYTS